MGVAFIWRNTSSQGGWENFKWKLTGKCGDILKVQNSNHGFERSRHDGNTRKTNVKI